MSGGADGRTARDMADLAVDLQLGLIGDNIAASQSPRLHRLAGASNGMRVNYASLIPAREGAPFPALFARAAAQGYRGLNITYPYKEQVVPMVLVSPELARLGAVNTVIFAPEGPQGHNTDYTGFMTAYRGVRGSTPPGVVALIGTGGVGRAVAFGLGTLGASGLRLVDRDADKARAMAADLARAFPDMEVHVAATAEDAAAGAQGLVNCTPVGMVGYPGTPLPGHAMRGAEWAFDAVYTPVETEFLIDAAAAGAAIISGWELFYWQGVHAWRLFTGRDVDEAWLRAALIAGEDVTPSGPEAAA
ncbi:shikimate dehydrogenase family protein [Paracoccus sanguinis]|uniref:Shikimate dehydrogenase n=1 Tax=Paracoccus sanguinis TaxID=1545044 RepID=A0A1H2U4N8_9RHOB|nr:shikimate dehydrogenase [Paracoccus sanguinis]SDW50888.1 shikimate dehydrogenase [Paracoccus sanguinis]